MYLEPVYKTIYIGGYDVLNPAMAELMEMPLMHFDAALRLDKIGIYGIPTPDHMVALEIPINDGEPIPEGVLPQATYFIHEHVQAGHAVLSQCFAGISRSVTAVLAYLIEYESMSLLQAYELIVEAHPAADPHPRLLASLIEHYALPIDVRRVENPEFWQRLREEASR